MTHNRDQLLGLILTTRTGRRWQIIALDEPRVRVYSHEDMFSWWVDNAELRKLVDAGVMND